MIDFNYETDFEISHEDVLAKWIRGVIVTEEFKEGDINYIFCDDAYLNKLNIEFLEHDTLTDIISFDYSVGKELHGDIFISIDRVKENAKVFNTDFEVELRRVMVHGVLHYCGFKDKNEKDVAEMRAKENFYLDRLTGN